MKNQRDATCQLSFEFFPPKTVKGMTNLDQTANTLSALEPEYFSVTFGAAGSEQIKTLETCLQLQAQTNVPVAPHLTCVGHTKAQMQKRLEEYQAKGIKHLVVLRGDQPLKGHLQNDFQYATDLVKFIRKTTGDHFIIEVAAYPEVHPQSKSALTDLAHFKEKIDAGANGAITQYFYNIDAYKDFIEQCQKHNINVPIVAGIMPIYNFVQLQRFSDMCGAELPRWMRKKIETIQDDKASLMAFGIDFVSELCNNLINLKAPGIHFYTLNRSDVVLEIHKQLDLTKKTYAKKPVLSR